MNLTYTTGIPDTPNNPSNDQPNMKVNTNSINSWVQVDHHGFGDNLGGYHTIVHQDTASRTRSGAGAVTSGFPAAIPNINQIFSALSTPDTTGGTADTQFFNLTGLGGLSQLTGNNAQADGYCWCGGILIQWGTLAFPSGFDHVSGTVTFKDRAAGPNIPFPNNCFVVVPQLIISSTSESVASNTLAIRDFSVTQFRFVFNSSSSTGSTRYPGFYWIAIGN